MRSWMARLLDVPVDGDMAQRADRAGVEHRLGALPAHDLMEIEIDHGRPAAERRPGAAWRARLAGRSPCGFSANTGLPSSSAVSRDLRLQARQRGDGDRLHVGVLDQRAPVAVRPSAHRRRGRARPCARRRCRRAPPPRSAGRRGMPAAARCGRNCSRRCLGGSRSVKSP